MTQDPGLCGGMCIPGGFDRKINGEMGLLQGKLPILKGFLPLFEAVGVVTAATEQAPGPSLPWLCSWDYH